MLTLETIKRIIDDIKADDEWVQDSHDHAEKRGIDRGLDLLYRHAEDVCGQKQIKNNI